MADDPADQPDAAWPHSVRVLGVSGRTVERGWRTSRAFPRTWSSDGAPPAPGSSG